MERGWLNGAYPPTRQRKRAYFNVEMTLLVSVRSGPVLLTMTVAKFVFQIGRAHV